MTTATNQPEMPTTAVFLNTAVPNMARIFDYLSGGTAHFEVDRQAAAAIQQFIPSLPKWVRLRRAFIQEAASRLYSAGFRQFLDFGSGMPADDHIHAFVPEAHVVFSDLNPVAVSYGQSIFDEQDNVAYIRGDVRHIQEIFLDAAVRRLIDPDKPVAIGLNAVILFLSEADIQAMAQALHDWAPAGSQIFMVFQTRGDGVMPEAYARVQALCRAAGLPIELHTRAQAANLMRPWRPISITHIIQFLELPQDYITAEDKTEIDIDFYGVFLQK